jgi:hypothetical protein
MNEMCDIFMCFVLFVTCFGWNFNAIVVVVEEEKEVTLRLYEWKELKKTIPLFEDRGPELRTMDNKVTGED